MGTQPRSVVQRLLRGRALYIILAIFIVVLYLQGLALRHEPDTPAEPAETSETKTVLDLAQPWPARTDRAMLQDAAAQRPGLRLIVSVISVAAGALALGGFGMLLWALGSGRIRSAWRFTPRALPEWSWGELARILLLTLFIVALLPFAQFGIQTLGTFNDDPHVWMTGAMLVLDVFVILAILAFAAGRGRAAWRTFGWSTRALPGAVATGLRGYVAVFPWLFVLLFLAMGIARRLDWTPPVEPIQELIFDEPRAGVLALTALLACAIGPLAEELFFRGLLFSTLRRRMRRWPATLISGSAFALLHTNVLGFPSILLLGCLLAHLYERTGSLASPLVVHVLHNTLLLGVALVARQLLGVVG